MTIKLGEEETRIHIVNIILGVIEETSFRYEMYLTANQIENYKYRVMFVGYGIAGYPVKVVLEQDIADELNNKEDSGYIYTIDSKTEFEELLVSVFNSKTMQKIIQNLITAYASMYDRQIRCFQKSVSKCQ